MDWRGCDVVEVIPGKVSGVPILKGTRMQADSVVENYESGESVEQIAWNFGLNPDMVRRVLAFAEAHPE